MNINGQKVEGRLEQEPSQINKDFPELKFHLLSTKEGTQFKMFDVYLLISMGLKLESCEKLE